MTPAIGSIPGTISAVSSRRAAGRAVTRPSSADARMAWHGADRNAQRRRLYRQAAAAARGCPLRPGQGRYVDDVVLPGHAWCAFVRSPHAHARIVSLSTRGRGGAAGRAADADRRRLGQGRARRAHRRASDAVRRRPPHELRRRARPSPATRSTTSAISSPRSWPTPDSPPRTRPRRSRSTYEPLPAVTTPRDAVAPGAPLVHPQFGSNLVFEIERGDRRKTEAALAAAAKVVELEPQQQPPVGQSDGAARPISATTTPRAIATRSMRPPSSRTTCGAGSRSTRCTFPNTKSG